MSKAEVSHWEEFSDLYSKSQACSMSDHLAPTLSSLQRLAKAHLEGRKTRVAGKDGGGGAASDIQLACLHSKGGSSGKKI